MMLGVQGFSFSYNEEEREKVREREREKVCEREREKRQHNILPPASEKEIKKIIYEVTFSHH